MKIAIDLMGGDNGIPENLKGALMALDELDDIEVVLIGKSDEINIELEKYSYDKNRVSIINSTEVITNNEEPAMAIRKKKDSSIVIGMQSVKNKEVAAFVSSGSTGALLSGAILIVKRIKGIERPAIGFIYPKKTEGFGFLLDAGANSECKPSYLQQFAIMGSIYSNSILGIKSPKVGLINIGSEKEKGSELYKKSYELISSTNSIEFVGNVEARDIFETEADILVCDGFTGNIILKTIEGTVSFLFSKVKDTLKSSITTKIGALFIKKELKNLGESFSYNEYGGAALLGVKGAVIKAHGSSDANTIKNAIKQARSFVINNVSEKIEEELLQED